jgi:TRAP transporter TAXI family solute receptor
MAAQGAGLTRETASRSPAGRLVEDKAAKKGGVFGQIRFKSSISQKNFNGGAYMLKKTLVLSLVLLSLFLLGCSQKQEAAKQETVFVTIGTASVGGTFYPLGITAARIFNSNIDNVKAVAIATAGSPQNIQMLASNEIEVAVIDSVECYWAMNAIDPYPDKKPYLRGLSGGLYTEGMQVIARKDANLKSMWDFKGKRVAVGEPGSGGQSDARDLLRAHDMTFDDVKPVYLEAEQAADLLKDGQIDAAILGLSEGSSTIAEMMLTGKFVILPIDEKAFQNYLKFSPQMIRFPIPANVYPNQDYEVSSVALPPRIFATREELPEDVAYNLCKQMYENVEEIQGVAAVLEQFNLERVKTDIPLLPYHAGSLKYFKEKGIVPPDPIK